MDSKGYMQASQLHTISLGPPASDWTLLQNFVSTKTSSWVEKFAKQWGRFLVTRFLSNKAGKALQKQAHNFEIFSLSHLNSYFLIDLLLNLQTFPWIIYSRSQQSSFYSITPKKHLKAKMNSPSLHRSPIALFMFPYSMAYSHTLDRPI